MGHRSRRRNISHGNPSGVDTATTSGTRPVFFQKEQELKTLDLDNAGLPCDCRLGCHWEYEASRATCEHLARTHHRPYYTGNGFGCGPIDCTIVNETKAAIEEQDPQKLGQLMSENHERLQQLGVSHDVIDTLVDTAHQNNALGAKVTGGGLGGCMIALVETEEDALHLQKQFMKQGAQAVWIQSLAKKENTK